MTIKPIKTKNFVLRPYNMKDAPQLAKLLNNRNVSRWMMAIPHPYSVKEARARIKHITEEYKRSTIIKIGLAIEKDGILVGGITIHRIQHGHKAEFGYWLGEPYWGQGIMTQVIQEFYRFAFREFRLKRLMAYTFLNNCASERVLIKNGFAKEGTLRKVVKKGSRYKDCHLYARVK